MQAPTQTPTPTETPLGFCPFFDKQKEVLTLLHRPMSEPGEVNIFNAVAGVGSGKTVLGAALMFESCTTINRGHPHAWTAPTYGMIDKFIVPTWRRCVPEHIDGQRVWTYYSSPSAKRIEFTRQHGGAVIHLISRDKPDRMRGIPLTAILHDEIGMDRSDEAWRIASGRFRRIPGLPRGSYWHAGISTPRLGWWADLVQDGKYPWVHWTSYDNPYDDRAKIEQLEADYGDAFARQEIYADFISLTGRIWDTFVDSDTDGNRMPGGHEGKGYVLAGDLGIHSAWLVIQKRQGCDVITAEYIPNAEGAKQTLARIREHYGNPYKVVIGTDVNTRWVGDAALAPMQPIRDTFPNIPPVVWPQGYQTDKSLQYLVTGGRICNTKGVRRLKVASDLKSYGRSNNNKRGILDMFKQDAWPEDPRRGEYLPKDKVYEHVRDALLYFCVTEYPPGFAG